MTASAIVLRKREKIIKVQWQEIVNKPNPNCLT